MAIRRVTIEDRIVSAGSMALTRVRSRLIGTHLPHTSDEALHQVIEIKRVIDHAILDREYVARYKDKPTALSK